MTQKASSLSVVVAIGLLTTALAGGMYIGALASDVEMLQKQEIQRAEDHDTLVALRTDVDHLKRSQDQIEIDVKAILVAVNQIRGNK